MVGIQKMLSLRLSMATLLAGVLGACLVLSSPPAESLVRPAIPWDLNGDGYAELVIGLPGDENRPPGSDLLSDVGRVIALRGTATVR